MPPSPPPRLGLLQCPNAASLGWTADGPKGGTVDGGDDEAGGVASGAVGTAADAPGTAPEAAEGADGDGGRAAKRARTRPAALAADSADPAGESTEPMKGPSPALPTTAEGAPSPPPSSAAAGGRVTASLDYEPDGGGLSCRVLTVRCPKSPAGDERGRTAFVGSISGRAELEVLDDGGGGGGGKGRGGGWSLDVFGHRPRPGEVVEVDRPGWTDALPLAVVEGADGELSRARNPFVSSSS